MTSHKPKNSASKLHFGLPRRNFLLLGSAFSLGVFSPIAWKSHDNLAAEAISPKRSEDITVGVWRSSDRLPNFANDPTDFNQISQTKAWSGKFSSNIVSANSLKQGDLEFVDRGARVTFHNLYSANNYNDGWRSLSANIYFKSENQSEPIKVHAWRFGSAQVLNISATTSHFVPVDRSGLKMMLELQKNSSDSEQSPIVEILTQLTVGRDSKLGKLQRGVYFLAGKSRSTGSLPNWQEYQFQAADPNQPDSPYQLVRLDRNQNTFLAADFPYLIVSVDYGDRSVM